MPETDLPDIPDYSDLSFEEAMGELETIVRSVDSNRLPLDEMIVGYEKGTRLHKVCKKRLEEARGRIELIRKRNAEEAELEAFDANAASAANAKKSAKKESVPKPESTETEAENVDTTPTLQDGELF